MVPASRPLLVPIILLVLTFGASYVSGEKTLYELLDVAPDAPLKTIQKAFRRLSLSQHPDKARGEKSPADDYIRVQRAYKVLADADLRMLYDAYGGAFEGTDQDRMRALPMSRQAELTLFQTEEKVVRLRNGDEHKLGGQLDRPWIIMFYAPWSAASQAAAGEWRRTAHELDGVAHVAAANCAEAGTVCRQYRISRELPTILLLLPTEQDVEEYRGPRTADALSAFVRNSMSGAEHVIELSPQTFSQRVQQSTEFWLVLFCDASLPCFHTKPHIRRMAASLRSIAKVGVVQCHPTPQNHFSDPFCEDFDVSDQGLPLLVAYPSGTDKPDRGEVIPLRLDERADAPSQTFLTAIDTVLRLALAAHAKTAEPGTPPSTDEL